MPCCGAPLVFADSMGIEPLGGAEVVVAGVVKVAAQEVRVVGQCGVMGHGLLLLSYPEMHYGQRENKRQVRTMDTHKHVRTHAQEMLQVVCIKESLSFSLDCYI